MIEKNAEYILKTVEGMSKIFESLKVSFEKSFTQLSRANTNFSEAKNMLDKFESEFKLLQNFKIHQEENSLK
jgi:hypothetical protein